MMWKVIPRSLEALNDEELLQAYLKKNDPGYFTELFRRYEQQVYNLCYKILKDPEESRDVTMSIFEKCLCQIPKGSVRSFSDWLLCLTRNECVTLLRRQTKLEEKQADFLQTSRNIESLPEEAFPVFKLQKDDLPDLPTAMEKLKTEQRICIRMYYFEEKSYQEIAEATNYPVKSVKSFLQNGRRKLRKILTRKDN